MLPPRFVDALFAGFNATAALLLALGTFVALPVRWLPVDLGAFVLLVAYLTATLALLFPASLRLRRFGRLAMGLVTLIGVVLVLALFFSAGHLYGIYGPVGRGGALLFVMVAALVVPYLIVFPFLELAWLRHRSID